MHQFNLAPERPPGGVDLLGGQDGTVLDRLTVGLQGASEVEEGTNFDRLCGAHQAWYTHRGDHDGQAESTDKLPSRQTRRPRKYMRCAAHSVPFCMALQTAAC